MEPPKESGLPLLTLLLFAILVTIVAFFWIMGRNEQKTTEQYETFLTNMTIDTIVTEKVVTDTYDCMVDKFHIERNKYDEPEGDPTIKRQGLAMALTNCAINASFDELSRNVGRDTLERADRYFNLRERMTEVVQNRLKSHVGLVTLYNTHKELFFQTIREHNEFRQKVVAELTKLLEAYDAHELDGRIQACDEAYVETISTDGASPFKSTLEECEAASETTRGSVHNRLWILRRVTEPKYGESDTWRFIFEDALKHLSETAVQ